MSKNFEKSQHIIDCNYKKAAFTLAEIICVITILGVVAAITIPSTIKRSQNSVLRTQYLKAYRSVNKALSLLYIDNPDYLATVKNGSAALGSTKAARLLNTIEPYFTVVNKRIGDDGIKQNYKNYNGGTPDLRYWFNKGYLELKDGTIITADWSDHEHKGIYIGIDVNGYRKKPNKFGHDFFFFEVMSNGEIKEVRDMLPGTLHEELYGQNTGLLNSEEPLRNPNYFKNLP